MKKGHTWGKCWCGEDHGPHPRGMLGKKHKPETLEKFKGRIAWNKGLTKETDERVEKYGLKQSETKSKNIEFYAEIVRKNSQKSLKGEDHLFYGRKLPPELKKKFCGPKPMLCGENNPMKRPEVRKKQKENVGIAMRRPEVREKFKGENNPMFGKKRPDFADRYGKKDEFEKNRWKAIAKKPTKPELEINKLLDKYFPDEWRYVGNGKFIIEGKCPDFVNINGKKKVIELFGDFWHQDDNPQDRIDMFKEYGWDCLIIWESELKGQINKLLDKIMEFCHE